MNTDDTQEKRITVSFTPNNAGIYHSFVTVKSVDSPHDVRLFELEVNVIPVVANYDLIMECPARQMITQHIPMVNNSAVDYNVNYSLKTEARCFTGTGETSVKKNSTFNYEIKFSPSWIGEYTAMLIAKNNTTQEVINYNIKAIATEPHAEKHIKLKGRARTHIKGSISVVNEEETNKI